ncbi:hypothetical protein [Taibaiella koreensis]|uniref:hypothetical protein n=1 Tax=Taibaiella koreensis TaxID=1268548 RepID=UPI000E5A0ACC|nr:hypothetical protein [Taibaiella koreensis]
MILLSLLLILLFAPFVLLLTGFILALIPESRKRGKIMLLTGGIWLVVELLIGFSICSNMHFGGGH